MSKVYSLTTIQKIPASLEVVWDFFSRPENLKLITPASLDFKILGTQHGDSMYAGQIIEYRVKPVAGIPVYWMTEITHVCDKEFFVDEQRYGPYSFWHHQHHFKKISGGVEMTDIVHYKIPLGRIGDLANQLYVGNELKKIFQFRHNKTEEYFGAWTN